MTEPHDKTHPSPAVWTARARRVHRWFHLGLAFKGADGLLQTLAGLFLLIVSPQRLDAWIRLVTERELAIHPDDWIGRAIRHAAHAMSVDTQHFVGFYLIAHGLVKVTLVVVLWMEKRWAFPVALAFMGLLLAYQVHRLIQTHSIVLLLFTLADLLVLWVIWRDRVLLARKPPETGTVP